LSIILFTAGVKLLLLPVTYKQMESSQRMQVGVRALGLAPRHADVEEPFMQCPSTRCHHDT
jgi:membrane protein insertase Oxa1/YidC/SpoIIIJ